MLLLKMKFQSPAPTMHRALARLQNKIGYCLTVPGISNRCVSQAWTLIFVNWLSSELVDFRPSKLRCQILLTRWAVVCFGSHGMEKLHLLLFPKQPQGPVYLLLASVGDSET